MSFDVVTNCAFILRCRKSKHIAHQRACSKQKDQKDSILLNMFAGDGDDDDDDGDHVDADDDDDDDDDDYEYDDVL